MDFLFDAETDYDAEMEVTFYGKAYRLEEFVEIVEKLLEEDFSDIKEKGL